MLFLEEQAERRQNLASVCLSPESRYADGGPTRRPACPGRGAANPLPHGCAPSVTEGRWVAGPGLDPAGVGAPALGYTTLWLPQPPSHCRPVPLTQGPLLDVPHFRKPGLKRTKFKYEPAGPVHFFSQSSEVHSHRKLVRTPGDRAG